MLGPFFTRAEVLLSVGSVTLMFSSAMVIGRSGIWGDLFTFNMYYVAGVLFVHEAPLSYGSDCGDVAQLMFFVMQLQ